MVTVIATGYPFAVDPLPKPANSVRLHMNPLLMGLAVDAGGNVYFPELDGNLFQRIDKVTPGGTMSAVSAPVKLPTGGQFTVQAVAFSPTGALYFSTFTQVYRLDSGAVTLIAGAPGFPQNVGDGGPATAARISNPSSLAFDHSGNLYITEPFDSRVRKVTPQGTITTFAGTGHAGYTGDGGNAASAKLSTPVDVKTDIHGNVYIADLTASVVRKVNTSGLITTVAGNGTKRLHWRRGPCDAGHTQRRRGDRRGPFRKPVHRRPALGRIHYFPGHGQQPHSHGEQRRHNHHPRRRFSRIQR